MLGRISAYMDLYADGWVRDCVFFNVNASYFTNWVQSMRQAHFDGLASWVRM